MGYAITWIAVNGLPAAEVLHTLGLAATAERSEFPEAPITGCLLESGWYLIFINEYGHRLAAERTLGALAQKGEVVCVTVEEHVMCSAAEHWRRGVRTWAVSHDAQELIEHLAVAGVPPKEFHAIREAAYAAQDAEGSEAEVDHIFDIPLTLAEKITSFRHDGPYALEFTTLVKA